MVSQSSLSLFLPTVRSQVRVFGGMDPASIKPYHSKKMNSDIPDYKLGIDVVKVNPIQPRDV